MELAGVELHRYARSTKPISFPEQKETDVFSHSETAISQMRMSLEFVSPCQWMLNERMIHGALRRVALPRTMINWRVLKRELDCRLLLFRVLLIISLSSLSLSLLIILLSETTYWCFKSK